MIRLNFFKDGVFFYKASQQWLHHCIPILIIFVHFSILLLIFLSSITLSLPLLTL